MSKEAFEKWARTEEFEVFHDGVEYVDHITNCARAGWQARQPEIDALKAENNRLAFQNCNIQAEVEGYRARGAADNLAILRLDAEVEQLRKDAEILNWLVVGGIYRLPCQVDECRGFQVDLSPEAIDAAMKEPK